MALKKNWPAVYADVEQLFNEPSDDVVFETTETVTLTGGRIEPVGTRSVTKSTGWHRTGTIQASLCCRTCR
jgi:hypothetical protein